MKKKKVKVFFIVLLSILLVAAAATLIGYLKYKDALLPASTNAKEVEFIVEDDMTINDVIAKLHEENFVQSETACKVYVKLNQVSAIYAGRFTLRRNMSVPEIFEVLSHEANAIIEEVTLTIIPGNWAIDVARKIELVTGLKADDIMAKWNDINYIDELMKKYPFITEEVLASEHCYLEGYLAPDTYRIYKTASIEEITETILNQTDVIYQKYKDDFGKYTIHQVYTLASVIQFEARTKEDMGLVSSVFYNRFNSGMKMQSSVTVCYALYDKYKTWEDCEKNSDISSKYNTYQVEGLPVGPICNPNEDAIYAALHPTKSKYKYFIANVNTGDMYFAETYKEHLENIDKYMY